MSVMADQSIDQYLEALKQSGKSSPAGIHWHKFFKLISKLGSPDGDSKPPPPLILAASSESDANKHHRLREQLVWSDERGFLDLALEFLDGLPEDVWNVSSVDDWHRDFHWKESDFD